jgi:hypothetical protein
MANTITIAPRAASTLARAPRIAIASAVACRDASTLARAHRTSITITINNYGTVLIAKQNINAFFGPSWDMHFYIPPSGL